MKREYTITRLLGISQQEVAMLLGIHRSQWSMYESGQRDLPVHAKQLLGEMLTYVQAPQPHLKSDTAVKQKAAQSNAKKLLLENEYQQVLLEKKIAAAEKKQETQMRRSRLMDFLDSHQAKGGKGADTSRHFIASKVAQGNSTDQDAILVKLKLKQKLLLQEKELLESKFKK